MKYQGKIFNWNDNKGFGFVEPNGGGERAFVHIKAFKSDSRRPSNGDLISYELVREKDNRYKADNIRFSHDANSIKKSISGMGLFNLFMIVFCIGLSVSVYLAKLPILIIYVYIGMSLITFIAYALDKSAAQEGRWRTKENTLHLFSLLCGWPGAYYAQSKLRHKSSKQTFKNVYWITVVLNLAVLIWLHTNSGSHFLQQLISPLFGG